MATLDKLVQLPCTCGRNCGRLAATLRVGDLSENVQDMVRRGIAVLRLAGGAELRDKIPKLPDDGNPLAYIPAEMIAGAIGAVHPACVAQELTDADASA